MSVMSASDVDDGVTGCGGVMGETENRALWVSVGGIAGKTELGVP